MKYFVSLSLVLFMLGCSDQHRNSQDSQAAKPAEVLQKTDSNGNGAFNSDQAKANLVFIKDQYLKMIDLVDAGTDLKLADSCDIPNTVCFPRALEHEQIYMEKLTKWTNGFYPGLLWKLLAVGEEIEGFNQLQQATIFDEATFYQTALISETKRGSTHDLGFLLYDSFGEALNYSALPKHTHTLYEQALATGRDTLATRYDQKIGLIKSWDWEPFSLIHFIEDGKLVNEEVLLADPWTYPVIVDNMMNLEFLFTSDNKAHHELALSHAKQTMLNHYFYTEDDTKNEFPIAYHVYDYGSQKPGNWQGLGNVSAWARGQGWSLYGFVTVLEFLKTQGSESSEYDLHVKRLLASIIKLLDGQTVPDWDYFANNQNAAQIAADQSKATARFSHILDLCDFQIADNILPYIGYGPIKMDQDILSDQSLQYLATKQSNYGEPLIKDNHVLPCGSAPFKTQATHIPKDTSAAALYASALYRLALHTESTDLKNQSISLADRIMSELSANYLTSNDKNKDYQLGFVLTQATGNLPNASEIDTSIVYADFYFLEANILKVELADRH